MVPASPGWEIVNRPRKTISPKTKEGALWYAIQAYAGLGDLAMSLGHFEKAAKNYEIFLSRLSDEIKRGDPLGLGGHEADYREKYEQAKLRWGIHKESMDGVVSHRALTRGFRAIKVKKKSNGQYDPQRLALSILFEFNSSELTPQGRAQLSEVAQTLQGQEFYYDYFRIEGHSDTIGDAAYNLELSRKRALSVRNFLNSEGIAPERLTIEAYGEQRPIVRSGSKDAQAVNRRVAFVGVGGM